MTRVQRIDTQHITKEKDKKIPKNIYDENDLEIYGVPGRGVERGPYSSHLVRNGQVERLHRSDHAPAAILTPEEEEESVYIGAILRKRDI